MADKIKLHPEIPHKKRVFEIADRLRAGDVMLFPSDTRYALGCDLHNKKGIDKIRQIRKLDKNHLFTLITDSLAGISRFANLSDENFKLIKRLIPGPYTFILPATKEVPRLLLHPSRKTIGFRVPDHPICEAIVSELGEPLVATSAKMPEEHHNGQEVHYPDDLFHLFDKFVELVIDDEQPLQHKDSTMIDFTSGQPEIIRKGSGFEKVEEVFLSQNVAFSVE